MSRHSIFCSALVWSVAALSGTAAYAQVTPQNTPLRPSTQAPVAPAKPAVPGITPASSDSFTVDFTEADIRAVITALANAGGLNVIFGDIPPRKTTLHLNHPVPRAEIPMILRNVATSNGLRISDANGIITIGATGPAPQQEGRQATLAGTELHIYQLKHANATKLAQVLQNIFTVGSNIRIAPNGQNQPQLQGRGRRQGGVNGGGNGGGGGGIVRFGVTNDATRVNGGGPGGAFQNLAALVNGAVQTDGGQIVIVPDETTNSLMVRASPDDWEVIQQAIQGIDIRPRQVIIEVMIAEVTRNDDFNFGVSASANGSKGSAEMRSVADTTASLIARFSHEGNVDISVALSALQTRGNVRVLSLPLVLAQNNHESVLFVGSRYPFVSSSRLLDNASNAVDQTVTYQDIGTTLDIFPTINPDGYVNLDVYQEVSAATSLLSSQSTTIQAPVFTNRNATASVFVKNGQIVVVGGLTDRSDTKIRSGVPLLSRIPVLGALFGTTTNSSTRTELYLFLTPHVVMSDADADHAREQVREHSHLMHAIPMDSVRVIDPQTRLMTPETNPGEPSTTSPTAEPAPSDTVGTPRAQQGAWRRRLRRAPTTPVPSTEPAPEPSEEPAPEPPADPSVPPPPPSEPAPEPAQ